MQICSFQLRLSDYEKLEATLTLNVYGETGRGDADRILGLHSIGGRVRTLDIGHVEKRIFRLEAIRGDLLAILTVPSILDLRRIRGYR